MAITHYGSCVHLISVGGLSFTGICTEKEALAIELALNIASNNGAQPPQADNTGSPTIARRIELLLEEWDKYEPDQKLVLTDIFSELQRASA